jgi:hypothetical protein
MDPAFAGMTVEIAALALLAWPGRQKILPSRVDN